MTKTDDALEAMFNKMILDHVNGKLTLRGVLGLAYEYGWSDGTSQENPPEVPA